MSAFAREFAVVHATTVLDVGGTPVIWELAPVRPRVTLLNREAIDAPGYTTVVGNGTAIDYPDQSFDIVFSNSVIEHLGTLENQRRFASEIRRMAPRLWVQTPARSFPLEPHHLAPFIHWLPKGVQRRLVRNFTPYGWLRRPSSDEVETILGEYRLLSHREMRWLFPDCEIRRERFLGLTKSYVAVRREPSDPAQPLQVAPDRHEDEPEHEEEADR